MVTFPFVGGGGAGEETGEASLFVGGGKLYIPPPAQGKIL